MRYMKADGIIVISEGGRINKLVCIFNLISGMKDIEKEERVISCEECCYEFQTPFE